jgi:hypothetical protein
MLSAITFHLHGMCRQSVTCQGSLACTEMCGHMHASGLNVLVRAHADVAFKVKDDFSNAVDVWNTAVNVTRNMLLEDER